MRDRLRPVWCDHLSILRGKYLPQEKIGSGGTRFAQPCFAVHYDKDLIVDAPGTACLEGLPDMELRWDAADIRAGWEPGVHMVTGDLYDRAGRMIPIAGRAALKTARLVGGQPELDAWRDSELLPGPGATSDEDLDAFIAKAACTHHHPSGTCRLGRDGDAVVDPDLRLIGLDNVFIVDASVIPAIPSGPINAAVVAIAETWSAACGAS